MTNHRPVLRLLASLAFTTMIVLTGLSPSSAASTSTAKTGWLRVANFTQGGPRPDVRLTPFAGGPSRTLRGVSFGRFSAYGRVPVGLYTVSAVTPGTPTSELSDISANVRVDEGVASTVLATGTGGAMHASVLADDLNPPSTGEAKVRLVSAATDPRSIDARVVKGPSLAQDITTGSSTGYADVDPQTWSVRLSGSAIDPRAAGTSPVVTTVPVTSGGTYTLLALDDPQGGLTLRTIRESWGGFSQTGSVPTTGIDTGGEGIVPDHTQPRAVSQALDPMLAGRATAARGPRTSVREPTP